MNVESRMNNSVNLIPAVDSYCLLIFSTITLYFWFSRRRNRERTRGKSSDHFFVIYDKIDYSAVNSDTNNRTPSRNSNCGWCYNQRMSTYKNPCIDWFLIMIYTKCFYLSTIRNRSIPNLFLLKMISVHSTLKNRTTMFTTKIMVPQCTKIRLFLFSPSLAF